MHKANCLKLHPSFQHVQKPILRLVNLVEVLICSSKTFGVDAFFARFCLPSNCMTLGSTRWCGNLSTVLAISKNQNSWISSDMGSKICFNETHKKNVPLWDVSVRGGCSKAKRLMWLLQRTRFRDLVLVAAVPEAIYGMRSCSRGHCCGTVFSANLLWCCCWSSSNSWKEVRGACFVVSHALHVFFHFAVFRISSLFFKKGHYMTFCGVLWRFNSEGRGRLALFVATGLWK